MSRVERMVLDIAGPGDLSKLHGLPASLSFAAMILTRLRRGRLDMRLPDGRTLRFTGKEPGITAEIFEVLSVENSVRSRTSFGGTAPDNVRAAAALARRRFLGGGR